MSPRTRPAKGFATRERHRVALTAHAFLMIAGLLACAVANRMLTPDRFWVQWIALPWAVLFGVHLWVFSRSTLATMGRRHAPGRPPPE